MASKRTVQARTRGAARRYLAPAPADTSMSRLPAMVMALDARGRVVFWNRECRRISGYDLSDVAGPFSTRLFPDAATRRRFNRERLERLGKRYRDWLWTIVTARGETRYIAWTAGAGRAPLPGAATWAVGRDVTELHTTVEALDRARESLSFSQQTVGFGAWSWDPGTSAITCTPELEDIYRVPRGAFGRRYADFSSRVHPDDLRAFEHFRDHAVARGDPFEYEFRIVDADGRSRWIHARGRGLHAADGTLRRVVGVDTDVTSRKQSELHAHEQDENLRVVLRSPDIVMFHQDRELRYTWVASPTLHAISSAAVGRTDEELLGKVPSRQLVELKRRVIRSGQGERQEVRLELAGEARWYDLVVEPKRSQSGRVVGVVGAAMNVTSRKRTEEALASANQRGRELAAHLRDTVERERMAISRDVHDQVGAILTAIRLRLASVASRASEADIALQAEVQSVEAMAESAMHATRDICSRLRPPSLEDIGLAETCRWYLAEWARTSRIRAHGRFPRGRCDGGPVADTDLFRILQELLTNVARHSAAANVQVVLSCARQQMRLRVADDGRGFGTDDVTEGFGLAGVRERARHHGGRVTVRSGAQGTAVEVTIPLGTTR